MFRVSIVVTEMEKCSMIEITCQNCQGGGKIPCEGAWGHYGDCNADAGEGHKPVIRECDACMGGGRVPASAFCVGEVARSIIFMIEADTPRETFLNLWVVRLLCGLTEKTQADVARLTGYTRQHISKKILDLKRSYALRHV